MEISTPGTMSPAVLVLLVAADIWHGSALPSISPNDTTLVVKSGDPVRLFCSGNSRVKWLGVTNGSKVTVYENGTLYIPRATCKDMRHYQCAYVSRTNETASVFLLVRDHKSFWCVRSTKSIIVTEGKDAVFPCLSTDPAFNGSVMLRKSKKEVPMEFSFNPREGLRLHNVRKAHADSYWCSAQVEGQWVDSLKIGLVVNAISQPISVTIKTKGKVRIQGEPFAVACRISYPISEYKVQMIHPSTANFSLSENYTASEGYFTDLLLSIPEVQLQDSGEYTCIGTSSSGSRNSSATLRVIESGYLHLATIQNVSQERSLHKSLKLQVLIEAYPEPSVYRWTHVSSSGSSEHSTYTGQMSRGDDNRYNNTLNVNWTLERSSGIYTFFADNGAANASISFNLFVKTPPEVTMMPNSSNSLQCKASGYPAPRIEWYKLPHGSHMERCQEGGMLHMNETSPQIVHKTDFGRVSVKSILNVEEMETNLSFCCLAVNSEGSDSSFSTSLQHVKGEIGYPRPLITAFAGTMIFLILCIIILIYKYKQKPKYQVHWKIIEAQEGNHYTFIDPTQLPYNKKWEFPRNNLQFGKILGAGAFGKVVEATAFGLGKEDTVTKVAVKMLKSTAQTDEQEALITELKIMSHLGYHENIVNLLGACTHGGPVLVITEYCPYGDLLNFLRKKVECLITQDVILESSLDSTAPDYKNIYLGKKYVRSDSGFGSQCVDNYLEMKPVLAKGRSSVSGEETEDSHILDLHDLLLFSNQVAQGMNFLASKNCIHRDLAARNVLVADGQIAKICDFGLARDIMNDTNYVVKGNARLPVKWMAPESIFECVYTVQSDVWSYGILLWEIFSLGRSPYPGMKVNSKFYSMVKQGYHMGMPEFAPPKIYNLMTACWNLEPTKRPTFNQICTFLQKELDSIKEQDYKNLPCTTEEDSGCEPSSYCEDSCELGETGQPLLNSNNYQFC
ncbi:macrophage colony-stimulating factor 1 receptor [Varanus komodoensis]|uniref:receptor protein-tyrosine kinase n=1 Tax=Varanus komodoensis TaxID=61221 RepID=A0A8D2J4R9_VARKO|nr:macrophage colony-stimulating factor 1 receptor [Varanus komodoensis]